MHLPELLKKEYAGKKGRNPAYSLRAFAKHLGLSPGTLSELISEKRPVTLKTAQKVLGRLDISNDEKSYIIS
ncbi:MAG: helix-turn-helix domain-containing protein, partial [Bdellovibrionales bacterium]